MPRKAFVLLSGGLDSTTCLMKAIIDFAPSWEASHGVLKYRRTSGCDWVEAVSIDYGQRHIKEAQYAAFTCEKLGIEHSIIKLSTLASPGTMLTDKDVKIPNISYADIKGVSPTYVPFRNGSMLSALTAHAQKWVNAQVRELVHSTEDGGGDLSIQMATEKMVDSAGIYFGAHSEDAANWAYPDCTPEFIGAMANAIYIGSYRSIRLYTPLQWLMKKEIVELGLKLNVDFANTWSCYAGGEYHCGTCPTCRSRREAFVATGLYDPTTYQDDLDVISARSVPRRPKTQQELDDEIPF